MEKALVGFEIIMYCSISDEAKMFFVITVKTDEGILKCFPPIRKQRGPKVGKAFDSNPSRFCRARR